MFVEKYGGKYNECINIDMHMHVCTMRTRDFDSVCACVRVLFLSVYINVEYLIMMQVKYAHIWEDYKVYFIYICIAVRNFGLIKTGMLVE